jgi:alkanesulfonate monooxygenase SsuD/methylene tetrahydromethanopterin reductase-like flavin-dependent oxidoreductase (luciferase family)
MHIMYFTERPYLDVPEDEVLKIQSFFGVPNRFFDPVKGARLLNEYLDDKVIAEELGFDGVMLNEHHGTPFCMGAVMDMEASILARITKKVRIVLLGNPLPVVANPLRLAEELAMIDMISGGRLVPGWVRGAGSEQLANNANPAYNREYFNEAHDLVIAAWTRPGPFRWEGKHFHYRFVNPWVLPIQKPHPPIWIPGLVSPETLLWCAKHRYPYLALATYLEPTVEMWNLYTQAAAKEGYQAGTENFGYLQKVFVAETEEKAQELGKMDLYGGGLTHFARGEWMFPPGYNSKEATRRMARQFSDPNNPNGPALFQSLDGEVDVTALRNAVYAGYEGAQKNNQIIVGTPKSVIPKLKHIIDVLRPGIFAFWQNDGPISTEARRTSMRLIAQEVIPPLREHAKKLGLKDPFERAPGSVPLGASGKPEPVARAEALSATA